MAADLRVDADDAVRFDKDAAILTIYVNDGKDKFCIHRELIITSSSYIRDYLWATRTGRGVPRSTLHIPHWTNRNLNLYLNWLYGRKIATSEPSPSALQGVVERKEDPEYLALTDLYRFAIEIKDSRFQDAILDVIVAKVESRHDSGYFSLPGHEAICKMYEDVGPQSKGQELMVDIYAQRSSKDRIQNTSELPVAFLTDLAVRLFDLRTAVRPTEIGECSFHAYVEAGRGNGRKRKFAG